jgi:hypothetical protein
MFKLPAFLLISSGALFLLDYSLAIDIAYIIIIIYVVLGCTYRQSYMPECIVRKVHFGLYRFPIRALLSCYTVSAFFWGFVISFNSRN